MLVLIITGTDIQYSSINTRGSLIHYRTACYNFCSFLVTFNVVVLIILHRCLLFFSLDIYQKNKTQLEYLLCYVSLMMYGSEVSQDQFGGLRFSGSALPTET